MKPEILSQIEAKLIHAVTAFDRKAATKPAYNPNALGIYFTRVSDIMADIGAGADTRAAIVAGFTGRLQSACLRELSLSKASDSESNGSGKLCYEPASRAE